MKTNSQATLLVSELFASIQGESTRAGLPCGFVRLAGCNLRCAWCDTAYAFENGREVSVKAILDAVRQWRLPLIEITGGEPLLQPAAAVLAERLIEVGHTVMVETNGTQPIAALPEAVIRIMDIKCPGSGMSDKTCWQNVEALNARDEVKFVLADRADYDWALATMRRHRLAEICGAVLFSPVAGCLDARQLAAWMVADGAQARLQLQLHKIIWPCDARGV